LTADPWRQKADRLSLKTLSPQHFDTNPFFSNSILKKEFKYVPPSDPEVLKKDANGVSQADVDFDFSRDVDIIVSILRHGYSALTWGN
jgi:hypothetical protein